MKRHGHIDTTEKYWTFPPAFKLAVAFLVGFAISASLIALAASSGLVYEIYSASYTAQCQYIAAPACPETEATDYHREHALSTTEQKQAYDGIENALRCMAGGYAFEDDLTLREVSDVYKAVLYDNPDIFWAASDIDYIDGAAGVRLIKFTYLYSPDEATALAKKHEDEARDLIEKVSLYDGVPENELWAIEAFHDWVVSRTSYESTDHDQTVAGVMDDGKAVCAGYSRTLKYLCDMAGIPCICVKGHLYGDFSKPHEWNMAVAGGEVYYIDSTWDDAASGGESWVKHDWFTTDAGAFEKSHWTGYEHQDEGELGASS